ncbi:MAG: hypothetical protein R3B46_02430 [Phycisphaerales bacterium]|nr:hypothetical protein [Phycisphaerales bacterium]MCA9305989.1 hypothetical protein [Phycisphaerales bacterium]
MARKFPNMQFGPMHLRRLLRGRFERHEHLIAWGPVTTGGEQQLFHVAMGLVPGIGPALGAVASASSRRVAVVTSRRILVILNRKPAALGRGKAVCFEAPHEYLTITRSGRKSPKFTLRAEGVDLAMGVKVEHPKKAGGRRLMEALAALSEEVGAVGKGGAEGRFGP